MTQLSTVVPADIRILLIEDNPLDARLLQEVLSEDTEVHWDVACVEKLAEAVPLFHSQRFDVVLLDLFLPDAQGLEAFHTLRRQIKGAPIVVITGLDDQALAVKTVQEGAQDYLVKGVLGGGGPLAGKVLGGAIRHAIARHKVLLSLSKGRRLERRLAYYDPLTRIPNRYLFNDRLSLAITQAKRSGNLLAVLFLDLDDFKHINDTYGHKAGDQLLELFAWRLRECVRAGDTPARLSGDEFAVLLNNVSSSQHVTRVVQKIFKSLGKPFLLEGHEVTITSSIGISFFPWNGADGETLIKNADVAMYGAKRLGKNNHQFFDITSAECQV